MPNMVPTKARYVMIAGFLGAGKTTAIARLAKHFIQQGLRVGLITNDQGQHLVDTAVLRAQGFPTEEIAGGCFCCRFNSLIEAARKLSVGTSPDVFVAEPVGSCTDLAATVTYPLRRLYGEAFTIAPISVLVDPARAMRVFDLEKGPRFSEKVRYIYHKQLEEADLIVISKSDLLDPPRLSVLREAILRQFPGKEILAVSVRNETDLALWFARIAREEQAPGKAMPLDYDRYAEGEALLGWLNCTIALAAEEGFDADKFLKQFAAEIQLRLREAGAEIAHLKMTLDPESNVHELGVVNVVQNDFVPELSLPLEDPVEQGQLILNLRAEADPQLLADSVRDALRTAAEVVPTLRATLDHLEQFRPEKPVPTHRIENAGPVAS